MSVIDVPSITEVQEPVPEVGTVAYEARRLDRLFPGWHNEIDIETLNLWNAQCCVLGQIQGGWVQNYTKVRQDRYDPRNGAFYADDTEHHDDWVIEILNRRG